MVARLAWPVSCFIVSPLMVYLSQYTSLTLKTHSPWLNPSDPGITHFSVFELCSHSLNCVWSKHLLIWTSLVSLIEKLAQQLPVSIRWEEGKLRHIITKSFLYFYSNVNMNKGPRLTNHFLTLACFSAWAQEWQDFISSKSGVWF